MRSLASGSVTSMANTFQSVSPVQHKAYTWYMYIQITVIIHMEFLNIYHYFISGFGITKGSNLQHLKTLFPFPITHYTCTTKKFGDTNLVSGIDQIKKNSPSFYVGGIHLSSFSHYIYLTSYKSMYISPPTALVGRQ